jgi:cellulose synthase/poly-beta-1,6-N-acetylglucosamine synthase-like glycosyltransferase
MAIGLLWIVGIYGFCTLLVHGLYELQRKKKLIHMALITLNNQSQIEWYLRSFIWVSWLRGRSIDVTVFDAGSTDETAAIVKKLADQRDNIKLEISTEGVLQYMNQNSDDEMIVLQLMNRTAKDGWLISHW